MDVFAETSDVAFMDAWMPEYAGEREGMSLVVVRSAAIWEILQAGRSEGRLEFREIHSNLAAISQAAHVRRKQELIRLRCKSAPIRGSGRPPRLSERLDWVLQRLVQRYSRRAWTLIGRKCGPSAYWLAMSPLAVPQFVVDQYLRLKSLATRAIKRLAPKKICSIWPGAAR
jgi:hypothetical protein